MDVNVSDEQMDALVREIMSGITMGPTMGTEAYRDAIQSWLAPILEQHVREEIERVQKEPVAWVPVHPRGGALWANTIVSLDSDKPSYPLMPLYAAPPDLQAQLQAENAELRTALKRLTFAARTSGGTAGPDKDLMEACDAAEKLLVAAQETSAAISALKAAAAELIATGCSSLCAVGEPCGVTGGQCAALTPKEGNNW